MVGHGRLGDIEHGMNIGAVHPPCDKFLEYLASLGIRQGLADPVELFSCELHYPISSASVRINMSICIYGLELDVSFDDPVYKII